MNSMVKRSLVLLFLICLFLPVSGWALNEETHRDINQFIGSSTNNFNGFSLDLFLKNQLGFQDGKNQIIANQFIAQEVYKWLGEGGLREDKPLGKAPYLRSTNHFHNPLQDISHAGFSGVLNLPFLLPGESSILWSQRRLGTQYVGGHYSWHDTRDYFYKALTTDVPGMREVYFAKTFRGLGQLMHLIEDLSVPEHARDDGHYAAFPVPTQKKEAEYHA